MLSLRQSLGYALSAAAELRLAAPVQPTGDAWRSLPIIPKGDTLLGVSFRTPQIDALGLDLRSSFTQLLSYPFDVVRLGAYWRRIEPAPGAFVTDELDFLIDSAEVAGKQVILCAGAVKTFGYPEFFVPPHRLVRPIREGIVLHSDTHRWLLDPACEFIARIVERYRHRSCIVAWSLEHEAVDPLGLEHSWRLGADFVSGEITALRAADPSRPLLLNGFLPMSGLVALQQWWRTRDQGDSIAFALAHADWVGLDVYPRHGLFSLGPWRTVYLSGGRGPLHQRTRARIFAGARTLGRRVMVSEGQAEPWETVVRPPSPEAGVMYSCTPEQMIVTYNACMRWGDLYAYLFWGAEYWLMRAHRGDPTYLRAFARILDESS